MVAQLIKRALKQLEDYLELRSHPPGAYVIAAILRRKGSYAWRLTYRAPTGYVVTLGESGYDGFEQAYEASCRALTELELAGLIRGKHNLLGPLS